MKEISICKEEKPSIGEILDSTRNKVFEEKSNPLYSKIKLEKKYPNENKSNLSLAKQSKAVFAEHSYPKSINKDCEIHLQNFDLFVKSKVEVVPITDEIENLNKKLSDLNLASQGQDGNFSDSIHQVIPNDKSAANSNEKDEILENSVEIWERGPWPVEKKKNSKSRSSPFKSVNRKHDTFESYAVQISDNHEKQSISHLPGQNLLHMCCSQVTEVKSSVVNDIVKVDCLYSPHENQTYSSSYPRSPESGYVTSPMSESPFSPSSLADIDTSYLENNINFSFLPLVNDYSNSFASTTPSRSNSQDVNDLEINAELFLKGINSDNTKKLEGFEILGVNNSSPSIQEDTEIKANSEQFYMQEIYHDIQKKDLTIEPLKENPNQEDIDNCFNDAEELIREDIKSVNMHNTTVQHITRNTADEVQPNYQLLITPVKIIYTSPTNQNLNNFSGSQGRRERPILPRPPSTSASSYSEEISRTPVARENLDEEAKKNLNRILCQQEKKRFSIKIYQRLNKDDKKSVIYIENEEMQSNLQVAIIKHELEHAYCIVEIHKSYYKKDSSAINLTDKFGKTALCYAVIHTLPLMVAYLLESGAMQNIKDKKGFTPLDHAVMAQLRRKDKNNEYVFCKQIIEILKKKGAVHSEKSCGFYAVPLEDKNMQSVQNHLIPYTCSAQRTLIQSGFQQSLSGSETDVSTSTENLTAEEKSVLQNGIRQEPQGEETVADDVDAASSNTLIIHNNTSLAGYNSPFYGQSCNQGKVLDTHNHLINQGIGPPEKCEENRQKTSNTDNLKMHHTSNSSKGSSSGSVPPSPKSSSRRTVFSGLHTPAIHTTLQQHSSSGFSLGSAPSASHIVTSAGMFYPATQINTFPEQSVQEITDIPKHYLDQSEVLKHLTKEMHHQHLPLDLNSFPPPPEYPKWRTPEYFKNDEYILGNSVRVEGVGMGTNSVEKNADRLSVSRSHPDLTHIGDNFKGEESCAKLAQFIQRPKTRGRAAFNVDSEVAASQASQMIELLSAENTSLKSELDLYYKKVSKLQKFELEIQKVHQAHEDLVRSSEKREKLERAIRMRLEMEIRRLKENNRELREQLDSATSHLSKRPLTDSDDSELRKELSKREVLIAQLLTQSKELLAEKERQEIELQAQRATLQEQRNHIDILDNALTNAQTNVVKLEEESRKKQAYVERVAQLQRALANLQLASDRRLQMEKKIRSQLEKEIETLRNQKHGRSSSVSRKDATENTETLKKSIREYEEKIIGLEAEVAKWEQRYLEESTMRQIAVDAASVPKDAKIAALEKTSQESEKLIAQARSEKLKHMDELYASNRKCTELESRIKDLESKLAERDAMIKVLQQHSQEKDAVLQHAVLGRPPRHARAASTVGLTTSTSHTTTTTGVSSLGSVSPSSTTVLHRRTGSKGEICTSSMMSVSSDSSSTLSIAQSSPGADPVTASKKSLDEQLKELDSRLSSKDSIISALRAEKERYPSHFWRV